MDFHSFKTFVKFLSCILAGLLLQSCRTVLFNAPQPISGERLTEFPIEQQGTFEAYSATKDTSTYFYFFSSYITEDYPKKEEINPSSKITILIKASNLKVSITDLKTNKTWSKTFGLSDTVILKKDKDLYVLNFLWRRTIENISDQGEVVNTVQKNDWFPLIFENYKNGWTVNFINGPWDTNSKKLFEEKKEENGFLILNDLTHDDLEKINKIKTNRLFQIATSAINFSSINVSKFDVKRNKKNNKDQESAFKIKEKKIKSETRYCRKAYNWLYKREVGNQPMAYIVQVGYSPKFEVLRDGDEPTGERQKSHVDDTNVFVVGNGFEKLEGRFPIKMPDSILVESLNNLNNIDSLENYEDYSTIIPSAFFDETFFVLDSIRQKLNIFDEIDLCKIGNMIPAQLAKEIIRNNSIYLNLDNENTNVNTVQFNRDFFEQKLKPYLVYPEPLLYTEASEDCGCGMGGFFRDDFRYVKKNYKEQKKTERN
jgi:hypothetical protein